MHSDTEGLPDSADQVDAVHYGRTPTVVLEVKPVDSDDTDLRRGVFKRIKYSAVMEAMDIRSEPQVVPVLVPQPPLPGDLAELAGRHGAQHVRVPDKLG